MYLATIVNRKTRGILDFALVERRNYETLQPLVDAAFALVEQVQQFYSDGLGTYRELIYRQGRRAP